MSTAARTRVDATTETQSDFFPIIFRVWDSELYVSSGMSDSPVMRSTYHSSIWLIASQAGADQVIAVEASSMADKMSQVNEHSSLLAFLSRADAILYSAHQSFRTK